MHEYWLGDDAYRQMGPFEHISLVGIVKSTIKLWDRGQTRVYICNILIH